MIRGKRYANWGEVFMAKRAILDQISSGPPSDIRKLKYKLGKLERIFSPRMGIYRPVIETSVNHL